MPRSRSPLVDSFAVVLLDLIHGMNWTHIELASRFGVSTKTIGRYVNGQAVPPEGRRHGILAALRDIDPKLLARVAASLGLSQVDLPPPPSLDHAAAQRIVDAAALEVAERLDAGPIRVRAALARFVGQLTEGHVSLGAAQTLLNKR